MDVHEAFFQEAQAILQEINDAILSMTDGVSKFCGTTDPNLFADIISTSVTYLCGVIGLLVDVGKAFQCSTWMPLYYNTVYNALCYNGIDGVWSIAATQFTTVLMACIILTFRAVFFDLEIIENNDAGVVDADNSSSDANGKKKEKSEITKH